VIKQLNLPEEVGTYIKLIAEKSSHLIEMQGRKPSTIAGAATFFVLQHTRTLHKRISEVPSILCISEPAIKRAFAEICRSKEEILRNGLSLKNLYIY